MEPSSSSAPPVTRTRFEFRAAAGEPPIRADLRVLEGTEPRSLVLICHGFKGFREWGFFPLLARTLASRGHATATFDFSRNGVGPDGVDFSALDRFAENTHSRNVDEIRAVLGALTRDRTLLARAPRHIGLFGHSRGGGEAVLAAAEDSRVDALVTWAAIASVERWSDEQVEQWRRGETVFVENARTGQSMPMAPTYWQDVVAHRDRLNILRAAAEVAVPWLIVHGTADSSVDVRDAHRLAEASGDNAELLLIEGAGHTFGAVHPAGDPPPDLRTAMDATAAWFDRHLQ